MNPQQTLSYVHHLINNQQQPNQVGFPRRSKPFPEMYLTYDFMDAVYAIEKFKVPIVGLVQRFDGTIPQSADMIIGFLNEDFGDIIYNGILMFRRSDFYKKKIKF